MKANPGVALGSRLANLARDLTSLEINTIVTDGITARPMKNPRHAFFDIGRGFRMQLGSIRDRAAALGPSAATNTVSAEVDRILELPTPGSRAAFEAIDRLADQMLELWGARLAARDRCMLVRIKGLSAELQQIFRRVGDDNALSRAQINERAAKAATDLQLEPEDMVTLRKVWEVGTETIVMQTVVTVAGDVTTRLTEEYPAAQRDAVFRFHDSGVRTALSTWQGVVSAVSQLVGGLFSRG